VASGLFTERGYDATSLQDIADRLGFTKAALYYHFPRKDDIFSALLEPARAILDELLDRLDRAGDVEGWADALTWGVEQIFDHLDMFKLLGRNRTSVEAHVSELLGDHDAMHERIERAAGAAATSMSEHVRMIAALGAVTGFDDWAPSLLARAPRDELRAALVAAVRDTLGLARTRTDLRASTG
jgi:AcrR family transcriptional regulator